MTLLPGSGALVEEGGEFERLPVSGRVADAVHAAALGVDHAARSDRQFLEFLLAEAEHLPLDCFEPAVRLVADIRVVADAQVGDALP